MVSKQHLSLSKDEILKRQAEKYYDKYSGKWLLYPHLWRVKDTKTSGFRCKFCGYITLYGEPDKDGMVSPINNVGCTERPEPCEWCGGTPECEPDCVGMRMALSEPNIHVIGNPFPDNDKE